MKILALDTTEQRCSVALSADGDVRERHADQPRRHAELLLPMVDDLLAEAGLSLQALDGIAFGRGPGSFTGVRIATAAAQGLALAADLPLAPVSSLLTLAAGARRLTAGERFLVALDARKGELYWAPLVMENGRPVFAGPEVVAAPDKVTAPSGGDWIGVGSGWAAHGDRLAERFKPQAVVPDLAPSARDLLDESARLLAAGAAVPPERALPVYLRDQVADPSASRS